MLKKVQLYPEINFLGIEIRETLVIEAKEHRDRLGLTNLYFLFGNINYHPGDLLATLPPDVLTWKMLPSKKYYKILIRVISVHFSKLIDQEFQSSAHLFFQYD